MGGVQAESYSAQDNVRNRITHENGLSDLEDLMSQIFARRAENVPAIPYVAAARRALPC